MNMCDSNVTPLPADTLKMLEDTLAECIGDGRAFTAYNITLRCRQVNGIKLRHQDVQAAGNPVHTFPALDEAREFGDYEQTPINHPKGDGTWAWLYHPSSFDPSTFQWEDAQAAQADPPKVRTDDAQAQLDQRQADDDDGMATQPGGQQDDGTHAGDYRGRLFIPTSFCRDAQFSPYDTAHVAVNTDTNEIMLAKTDGDFPDGYEVNTTRVIERNGDVRLTKSVLQAAGLNPDSQKFNLDTEEIGDGSCPTTAIKITAA
jgi:hypothetical protein